MELVYNISVFSNLCIFLPVFYSLYSKELGLSKLSQFYSTKLNVLTLNCIKRLFQVSTRIRVKLINLKGNPSPLIQNPLTNTNDHVLLSMASHKLIFNVALLLICRHM